MDSKKILVLLIALIIYVNYINYMKIDISKLYSKIRTLKSNIDREIEVHKGKYTKESLKVDYENVAFDGKKYSYSKAMGAMQNIINESAKDVCDVKRIKWAQVPTTKAWYDKLRMNVSISCTPKNMRIFTNKLAKADTIFVIENIRITKDRNKDTLNSNIQLVSFRTHK